MFSSKKCSRKNPDCRIKYSPLEKVDSAILIDDEADFIFRDDRRLTYDFQFLNKKFLPSLLTLLSGIGRRLSSCHLMIHSALWASLSNSATFSSTSKSTTLAKYLLSLCSTERTIFRLPLKNFWDNHANPCRRFVALLNGVMTPFFDLKIVVATSATRVPTKFNRILKKKSRKEKKTLIKKSYHSAYIFFT